MKNVATKKVIRKRSPDQIEAEWEKVQSGWGE